MCFVNLLVAGYLASTQHLKISLSSINLSQGTLSQGGGLVLLTSLSKALGLIAVLNRIRQPEPTELFVVLKKIFLLFLSQKGFNLSDTMKGRRLYVYSSWMRCRPLDFK